MPHLVIATGWQPLLRHLDGLEMGRPDCALKLMVYGRIAQP